MSGAAVYRITMDAAPLRYLKIAEGGDDAAALREEIARTAWLGERGVRVPTVIEIHDTRHFVALLMSGMPGESAETSALPQAELVRAVAHALAALHALPAADCPFDESIAARLGEARRLIARGEISGADFAPRNRGTTPAALLERLAASAPEEDHVVAHGDATLSNMIVGEDRTIGFIDCGRAGRADRYLDLAAAAESIVDRFGPRARAAFARAYGEARWNARKAQYFSDLYELF